MTYGLCMPSSFWRAHFSAISWSRAFFLLKCLTFCYPQHGLQRSEGDLSVLQGPGGDLSVFFARTLLKNRRFHFGILCPFLSLFQLIFVIFLPFLGFLCPFCPVPFFLLLVIGDKKGRETPHYTKIMKVLKIGPFNFYRNINKMYF